MTDLEDFLGQVFETLLQGEGKALKHDEIFHAVDARSEFMCSFLVQDQTVFSAYPYVENGAHWPIIVEKVHYGPSPLEGQVEGHCHGVPVTVFDTLSFRNRVMYENNPGPHDFRVSGLAYHMTRANQDADRFVRAQKGQRDEFDFTGTISAARNVPFWEFSLAAYDVFIPTPSGSRLTLTVYTPDTAQEQVFNAGDRVDARIWLFGQVLPTPEDLPAQTQEESAS